MGKASRRKKVRLDASIVDVRVLTEAGHQLTSRYGEEGVKNIGAEILRANMRRPRLLSETNGEYFFYDLEDPRADTPLVSLLDALTKKCGPSGVIPQWLAYAAIEEPWEHAAQGYEVRLADVLDLHATIPEAPVTPRQTWDLVLKKAAMHNAECEKFELENVARSPSVSRATSVRI